MHHRLLALVLIVGCASEEDSGMVFDFSTEVTSDGGGYTVSWAPEPDPLPFNEPFSITFSAPGASEFALDVTMPTHGHGMQVEPLLTPSEGALLAEGLVFHMSGVWQMDVEVDGELASFYVECCDE